MGRNTISQLSDKRRRLHGELLSVQKDMLKLRADISALDHTLLVMGYQSIPSDLKPIRPVSALFGRNELSKLIAKIRRERPDLPTNKLIAIEIIERKGWDNHDAKLLDSVSRKVDYCKRKNFKELI